MQRLVDAAAGLQQRREEAPVGQLGDLQLDVAGLSRQRPSPMTVSFIRSGLGAFVAGSADVVGRFELDQLLHHQADGVADQVDSVAGA